MNIRTLETKFLKKYPAKYALEWDKTGLLCGDPQTKIKKVAVALDPTISAVKEAQNNGCNLLITHHPALISGIDEFQPTNSGALIYEAINRDVALMNFHTALDVSKEGTSVLPKMLNLKLGNILCPVDGLSQAKSKVGFGRINTPKGITNTIKLNSLANRCKEVFGRNPRVWGQSDTKLKHIATSTGSCGRLDEKDGVLQACLNSNVDCLVTGEIKYHDALSVVEQGMCVVDLGHDVSELPLADIIKDNLITFGIKKRDIILINQRENWI